MEIVITLERTEGEPSVAISSENPNITVIREPGVSNRELLVAYADALESHDEVVAELKAAVKK